MNTPLLTYYLRLTEYIHVLCTFLQLLYLTLHTTKICVHGTFFDKKLGTHELKFLTSPLTSLFDCLGLVGASPSPVHSGGRLEFFGHTLQSEFSILVISKNEVFNLMLVHFCL